MRKTHLHYRTGVRLDTNIFNGQYRTSCVRCDETLQPDLTIYSSSYFSKVALLNKVGKRASCGAEMTTSTTMSSTLTNTTDIEVQDDSDKWEDSPTPRITFLSVFICVGFIGNLFLIITICHSRRFRSVAFYIFVSNLAITNICECLLNMTVLLTVTISNAWTFGNAACRVSAFFLHLICIEVVLSLTILTTDRLIAVRFKDKYDHVFSTPRISIMICYTWFQSLAFSLPVAVGAVPSSANNYIKHCSIAKGGSIAYGIISTLACVIVPLVLMIVFFVKIIRTGYKDRTLIRSLISQHNYKDESQPEPRIKTEIRYTNITGTLCVAWLVVNGPYVVTLYFNMLQNSSELDKVSDKEVEYVWYIDLVLLWLRFSFTLVLPIAAFTWNKELWKSFKDMILCRKNNAIVDESFRKNETDTQKLERKINEEQNRDKEKEKEKQVIIPTPRETHVFHVPVLFATSDGVHVRTQEDDSESETSDSKNGGALRGKKCDVIGSQDQLNNLEDDTSDYDTGTEMDPFSISHPVSGMRKIIDRSDSLSGRHRSASQPEVRDKAKKGNTTGNVTVGSTSAADSGLDLSIMNHTLHSQDLNQVSKNVVQKEAFIHTESIDSGNSNHISDLDTNEKLITREARLDQGVTNSRNKVCHKETDNKLTVENVDCYDNKFNEIKDLKSASEISIDSPLPKRRKKKRRQDKSDISSQGTASPVLPPRPPPRLTPITSNIKTQGSGLGRPGSSCSNQYSSLDLETMQTVEVTADFTKTDLTSLDNLSLSSFTSRNLNTTVNTLTSTENETFGVEIKRAIPSVPEEVSSYNGGHQSDNENVSGENKGQTNNESSIKNLNRSIEEKLPPMLRNSDARKKRREKIAGNSILNEGKGYTRLKSDS